MRGALVLLVTGALASRTYAQQPADHVAMGVSAEKELKPDVALKHYQAALTADSLNYEANWRGAAAAIQVAQLPSSTTTMLPAPTPADSSEEAVPPRSLADSMYSLAETYARRASGADDKKAEGHAAVAFVLGSKSVVSDPLTRLSMAREIFEEASKAITLDRKNDAAHHILGQWYAEIMRLSDFERGYADGEIGDLTANASWDVALKHLETAVELAPAMIYHRLDLARAYAGAGRPNDAKTQITTIETLSDTYVKDPDHKAAAKALLASLENGGQKQPKQP